MGAQGHPSLACPLHLTAALRDEAAQLRRLLGVDEPTPPCQLADTPRASAYARRLLALEASTGPSPSS